MQISNSAVTHPAVGGVHTYFNFQPSRHRPRVMNLRFQRGTEIGLPVKVNLKTLEPIQERLNNLPAADRPLSDVMSGVTIADAKTYVGWPERVRVMAFLQRLFCLSFGNWREKITTPFP